MPRLSHPLIHRARALHPLLPLLLRPCRELRLALNELRWLREHAITNRKVTLTRSGKIYTTWPRHLHRMCLERARGKPLQYILGTQPFGGLEVLCRRGVLIPRPETENTTTHLASLLLSSPAPPSPLRILDLCTGTGCIPLLLHSLLSPHIPSLHLRGVDISPAAIDLAHKNLYHNTTNGGPLRQKATEQTSFVRGDVFTAGAKAWNGSNWDILISNPPYISPSSFNRTTARSVRNYEPKSALVPLTAASSQCSRESESDAGVDAGDRFYPRLLEIAEQISARVLLVEVGDMEQACRVVAMVGEKGKKGWEGCEIWRDWPAGGGGEGDAEVAEVGGEEVRVTGDGNGRAVLAWRRGGGRMLGMK